MRALAAFGVFCYHQHIGSLLARYTHFSWINAIDTFGAVYALPLFFLISGYCIHFSCIRSLKNNQPLQHREYFARRFRRIYPPYLVALIFSILVNYITGYQRLPSMTDITVHLFLLQGFTISYFNSINVVLWTITVEMAFYILYPAFYFLRRRYSLNTALSITLIVSAISIIFFASGGGQLSSPQQFCVFNIWFAWCCGAFLADKMAFNPSDLEKPVYKVIYAAVFVLFIVFKIFNSSWMVLPGHQFNILIWSAPMIWLIRKESWLAARRSLVLKILAALGLSSYSLYLFHDPLIMLKNYLAHRFLPANIQPIGVFIGIIIIPMITWFCYKFIEKPFMHRKQKMLVNA